jgi:hypothetical protein
MIFGWDVSTAIIGHARLSDDGQLLSTAHCDLRKIDGLNEKADRALNFVHSVGLDDRAEATTHFIEDRLSGFSGGGSNAGTVMRLAAFNAMVSWMIWNELGSHDKIVHLHPSTVKAQMKSFGLVIPKGGDKKELTLGWARSRPGFPQMELTKKTSRGGGNPQPWFYDIADAYVTALAGIRKVSNG